MRGLSSFSSGQNFNSLRPLSVLGDFLGELSCTGQIHRKDAENAEGAQR